MATTTAKKCLHCGATRPVCRPVEYGDYCVQKGLIPNESFYVQVTPDPIGEREAGVIADYTGIVAEAEQRIDLTRMAYANAEAAWSEAMRELHASDRHFTDVEHRWSRSGEIVCRHKGTPPGVLRARVEVTKADLAEADDRLRRARVLHGKLQREFDAKRTTAKLIDKGQITAAA